ncbi:MAG TPA: hypothetical protein VIL46_07545, partial [Gemmataceae bacterium]
MATASALPPTLQEKLAELNRQVRARRTARGLSLTLLALTVLAAVAVAADALLDFPAAVRGGLLIAWAVLGAAVVWRVLLRPLTRPVSPADLAAAVESEFPVLGERLSSTVELAERADPGNGSPYLIGLLARETEIRTRRLDFGEAVSTRDARWLTVAAGVALLAALAPLLFAPPAREHARRFFLPWVTAPLDVPYQVVVTSGDPAVRRGDPVTLAAYAEPTRPGAEVPAGAELLVRRDGGPEEAFGMQSTQANVYFLKRERVDADFEYAVRVGHARSDWHRVRAVDPVELTGETKITVTPPEYAKAALGEATLAGFGDIAPLQHSSVTFDLRFTRPPAVAALEWLPADAKPGEAARRVSLPAGGEQAAHTLQARQSGTLRLILETEEGVRTEVPPLKIDVRPDGPPRFSRVTGVTEQAREVPPGERVPVSFTVLDDVAVGEAALEYRVNGGPVQTQAIPLPGAGRQEVTTDCELDLAGKASEGDRLEFRLRAADNRDLPGEKLGPQVAYFPSGDRWAELRIARGAEPLKEQEITAQQREIERRLDDLLRELKADARTLYSLQVGAKNRDRLPFEQEEQIRELRDRARANAQALDELARDTALTPELQALADQFRDVADRQLRPAEDALREADRSERADPRDRAMARAQDQIGEAIRRLEQLQEQGERLARERIEREQLERLAREQQELAEKAAKAGPQELPEIQRRQRELEQELERLTRESDALREAANANKQEQAEELARRARDLADRQRELEQAMRETEQQARSGRLAELLERQKDLARRAAEFARENDQATRAAQARP